MYGLSAIQLCIVNINYLTLSPGLEDTDSNSTSINSKRYKASNEKNYEWVFFVSRELSERALKRILDFCIESEHYKIRVENRTLKAELKRLILSISVSAPVYFHDPFKISIQMMSKINESSKNSIMAHIGDYLSDCCEFDQYARVWNHFESNILPLSKLKNYTHEDPLALYNISIFDNLDQKVTQVFRPFSPYSNFISIFPVMQPLYQLWKEGFTVGLESSNLNVPNLVHSFSSYSVIVRNINSDLMNNFMRYGSLLHEFGLWPGLIRLERLFILPRSTWDFLTKWKSSFDLQFFVSSHVPFYSEQDTLKFIRNIFGGIFAEVEFLELFGTNYDQHAIFSWRITCKEWTFLLDDPETLKTRFDKSFSAESFIIDNMTYHEKLLAKIEGVRVTIKSELVVNNDTVAYSTIYRILSTIQSMQDSSNFRRLIVSINALGRVQVSWILWISLKTIERIYSPLVPTLYRLLYPATKLDYVRWDVINNIRKAIYLEHMKNFSFANEPIIENISFMKYFSLEDPENLIDITEFYPKYGSSDWNKKKKDFDDKILLSNNLDISSVGNAHDYSKSADYYFAVDRTISNSNIFLPEVIFKDTSLSLHLLSRHRRLIIFKNYSLSAASNSFIGFYLAKISDIFLSELAKIPGVSSVVVIPGNNNNFKIVIHAIYLNRNIVIAQLGFLLYRFDLSAVDFFEPLEAPLIVPAIVSGEWFLSCNNKILLDGFSLDEIVESISTLEPVIGGSCKSICVWRMAPIDIFSFSFDQGCFQVLDDLLRDKNVITMAASFDVLLKSNQSFVLKVGVEDQKVKIRLREYLQNYRNLRIFFSKFSIRQFRWNGNGLPESFTTFSDTILLKEAAYDFAFHIDLSKEIVSLHNLMKILNLTLLQEEYTYHRFLSRIHFSQSKILSIEFSGIRDFYVGGKVLISSINSTTASINSLITMIIGNKLLPEIWVQSNPNSSLKNEPIEWNFYHVDLQSTYIKDDGTNESSVMKAFTKLRHHGIEDFGKILATDSVNVAFYEKETFLFTSQQDPASGFLIDECYCILDNSPCPHSPYSYFSFNYRFDKVHELHNSSKIYHIMKNILLPESERSTNSIISDYDFRQKGATNLYGQLDQLVGAIFHTPSSSFAGEWTVHVWLRNQIDPEARQLYVDELLFGLIE